jgi:TolB-like protein
VIGYAIQILEALEHAHAKRVIHSDLKTANVVMTSTGRAKVLDFGLARQEAGSARLNVDPTGSLTLSGIIVGTPHYMAPEVLHGQRADARSDLWALGVMLHEMCAGSFPFDGPSVLALYNAIVNSPPAPLPDRVPAGLKAVIARLLAKDPGQRYANATEAKAALEALRSGSASVVMPRRSRTRWTWVAAGILVAIIAAVAYVGFVGRHLPPPFGSRSGPIRSIAVLPLANLSGDPAQDYFADGMTEELITQLAPIDSLKVISRTSVMHYKGTKMTLPEIARQLGVDGIVEGSVMRSGDRVRITAQLIDAAPERYVWGENYERDLTDVLDLQREVARDITAKIQLQLSPAQTARLASRSKVVPEAYELYLRGRFEWSTLSDAGVRRAIRYYEQAIVRDSNDARPYAGIANAYLVLAYIVRTITFPEALPLARRFAAQALKRDPASAEAHTSMAASLIFNEHDWAEAERHVRLATQLNPGYPGGHLVYAILLGSEGRHKEALDYSRRAIELDPLFLIYNYNLAWQLYLMHRFDPALAQAGKTLKIESRFAPAIEVRARIKERRGRVADAITERRAMQALGRPPELDAALEQAYRAQGARGYREAQLKIARNTPAGPRHSETWIASIYGALGERDSAFASLDRAFASREGDLVFCKSDPSLDGLRSDPRMRALIARMNLEP